MKEVLPVHITTRVSRWVFGALLALAVAGCSAPTPEFVDSGNEYTKQEAISLLEESDAGSLSDAPTQDSETLRREALARLRQQGGSAQEAARVITEAFAGAKRGVPYRVERATFDGAACWIVLEAAARTGSSRLDSRRLWVLDPQGTVLLYGSR